MGFRWQHYGNINELVTSNCSTLRLLYGLESIRIYETKTIQGWLVKGK
jgi:hypothetical protein